MPANRFLLALLLIGCLKAQTSIAVEGQYWFTQLHATIRVEKNGIGTDIDAKKDLGFGDSNFPAGRVSVSWGHNTLRFEYTPIDFSGDQTVSRTLIFNGNTYTVGTRVISGLEIQDLQLGWSYGFRLGGGRVRLGPLVEVHGFLLSGHLRAPEFNIDSREDLDVGLPTVGPTLTISPHPKFDIYGEATGMWAGDYGNFVRSEAGVRVRPVRHIQFTAGYRTFNLKVTHSADFANPHLRGPFVGAGFYW